MKMMMMKYQKLDMMKLKRFYKYKQEEDFTEKFGKWEDKKELKRIQ